MWGAFMLGAIWLCAVISTLPLEYVFALLGWWDAAIATVQCAELLVGKLATAVKLEYLGYAGRCEEAAALGQQLEASGALTPLTGHVWVNGLITLGRYADALRVGEALWKKSQRSA